MSRRATDTLRIGARRALSGLGARVAPVPGHRILMYHRVCGDAHRLAVHPDAFRRHLDHLSRRGWTVVSVSELLRRLAAGDDAAGRRLVALSFDDGYREMHTLVAPELRARGMGATFFVLPEFADAPRNLAPEHAWSDGCPYLTIDMIRALDAEGFEMAAHGVRHHVLTEVDDATARHEIADSRRRLRELLGHDIAGFAYPRGALAGRHVEMVENARYAWAATVAPGVVESTTRAALLPRTEIAGGDDAATLDAKLRGGLDRWHAWRQGAALPAGTHGGM